MTSKKTVKAMPVVAKKTTAHEEKTCACGKDCHCGDHAACKRKATLLKCGTMLVSSAIIAAAIVFTAPSCPFGGKKHAPFQHRGDVAAQQMKKGGIDEAALRDFLMKNPKVLIDSVDAFYKAKEAKAAAQPQVAPADIVQKIVNDKTNYSLGNPKGKFVIIEFFDYNCGWCKKTNAALKEVVSKKEGSNIRWIPIDTPIFGEASETIARYVLAAGKQGKYAEMHDAVGEAKSKVDEAALIEMAKKLKLDTKKLKADANGEAIKAKMVANQEFAKTLNINGVPMLIVDGKINPGALLGERLDAAVKASQAKK